MLAWVRTNKIIILVALAACLVGAALMRFADLGLFSNPDMRPLRESDISSSSGYAFTDPLVTVSSNGVNAPEYAPLQKELQQYIDSQKSSGLSSSVSVRFSDIEASESFTINPDVEYDPASLSKVPLAMAYYALAEQGDPSVLSDRIYYSGDPDLDSGVDIEPSVELSPGQSYSAQDMIDHMLRYSDNNAEQLLADHLSQIGQLGALQSLFDDLGIKINPDDPDYMTVGSYALFLRVLFNATYLDRVDSEAMLKILSQGDFTAGLSAGVPSGISIAQKFGDARVPDSSGQIVGDELHNCGIVYYPNHPYLLCVMTKGADIPDLERFIAQISQDVYKSVNARYGS